jgi:SAM-dependent methyltransferase
MHEERVKRLFEFVQWAGAHITGDEKGQAQIFLDRLFQAFGHQGCLDVGGTPEFRIRKPSESGGGVAFADYVWKPFVLIEMKKGGEDLSRHYRQAFDYWVRLVPGRPRYAVLCNFDEFWVYDFETQMDAPVDRVALSELPERYGPLAFLFPSHDRPIFGNDHEKVTRDAADKLATCFNKLIARNVTRDSAQRFILQMLVALFAEDIGLLERYFVTRLLDQCEEPADSYDLLGGLFEAMNRPQPPAGGRYKGVDYFNGGLFQVAARVELYGDELSQLRQAAKADWSKVRPEIFGTLFEHSLEKQARHAYGGHFTHPTDIMKIVGPTVVEPWREAIEKAARGARPVENLERLHHRMQTYHVLDPACGSGNFLYLAYRELKRLERALFDRLAEVSKRPRSQRRLSFVTARQFYGIDINPFAVEIAKVTMMIARKLAIDELHVSERPLPLDNLDENFIAADALLRPLDQAGHVMPTMLFAELEQDPWKSGRVVPLKWPEADVIIGNPPFLGAKRLKPERGTDYVNALRKKFPSVPGMADYCVYWLRLAHDHLPECTRDDPVAGRAGLVGTQNVRNNKSRQGGLDHIVKTGTIVEAVDNQPWSGEANVHVSIVNWVKTRDRRLLPKTRRLWQKVAPPPERRKIRKRAETAAAKEYELEMRECAHINSALSCDTDVSAARVLECNADPQRVFNGQFPRHQGFVLKPDEARRLIADDRTNAGVVHPFLIGRVMVTSGSPDRWVIDFQKMDLLEARRYAGAFRRIERTVLPHVRKYAERERKSTGREVGQDQTWLRTWWQHFRCRKELIDVISGLSRYIACPEVTKRPVFCFLHPDIRPDHTLEAFAFDDDYSFGVLQSDVHWQWFVAKCSKLTERFRYTPESVFDTFPWPQAPSPKQVRAVAEAGREVRRVRGEALATIKGGLRAVYRTLELPGRNPLKDAHVALDAAVLDAYGFSPDADLLQQLLDLNLAVADRIHRNEPVTPPGIPPDYPTPEDLVSDDCIRPAECAP